MVRIISEPKDLLKAFKRQIKNPQDTINIQSQI